MTTHDVIERIIQREGGYVDHPLDRGGPTKFGITLSTLGKWHDTLVTPSDVKALSPDEAARIYLNLYVQRPGFEQINDDRLRGLVVDCGVLHGTGTVTRWLQSIVEVLVDGTLGSKTLQAINSEDARAVYLLLCGKRMRFIGKLIEGDHSQAVFAHGWLNRVAEFVEEAA